MSNRAKLIYYLIAITLGLVLSHRTPSACQVDEFYLTKNGYLAALTPEKLIEAIAYQERDNEEGLVGMTKDGMVIQLKEDIKVKVLERSFEWKMLKIRFSDAKKTYWIKDSALKQIK